MDIWNICKRNVSAWNHAVNNIKKDSGICKELVKKELNVKDIFIHYIEPVIGCHSGPGTLALFFMGTKR